MGRDTEDHRAEQSAHIHITSKWQTWDLNPEFTFLYLEQVSISIYSILQSMVSKADYLPWALLDESCSCCLEEW